MANEQRRRFEELDVERINIVDADGKIRLAITNPDRCPDPVIDGKTFVGARQDGGHAGMLFYNGEGDECGGLVFEGGQSSDGYKARGGLLFDQFKQDEIVGLVYDDTNGERRAGLLVKDQPEGGLSAIAEELQSVRAMEDGPSKDEALARVAEKRGPSHVQRVFVGRTVEGEAGAYLSDSKGQPRIRLYVDENDAPRLEFLGETGEVVFSFPPGA